MSNYLAHLDALQVALRSDLKRANDAAKPEDAVAIAINVYAIVQSLTSQLETVGKEAKQVVEDVMTETGKTEYKVDTGSTYVSAPSTTIRYDANALDILCGANAALKRKLAPHRTESPRPGTLNIRPKKV